MALSLGRGVSWHDAMTALLRVFTAVGFTSSSLASQSFSILLCLLKSSLVSIAKCLGIICNDGSNHFRSAQRTKAQVLSACILLLDGTSLRLHGVSAFNLA